MQLELRIGWMVVVYCPCSPDQAITYSQHKMIQAEAELALCDYCKRPLIYLHDDGHLYAIGDVLVKNAKEGAAYV
ncbi:hypothetical protein ACKE5C_19220 (plasmid) [Aneurinibacillus thermoaerophilus]|uniref:CxxH/CxxC protein, BA_5709 family n=1 Tax=Aneurinibacillus thermoaerophilus TaxID=143495 RepID=A0ABX8YG18_ANETH|nr:hypothetical protein [Aneurinibacillus thermoaerophilus]QYY44762.1 hypothetical protein K3F53_19155 [Aneurinibacillus thermoaerophilus]